MIKYISILVLLCFHLVCFSQVKNDTLSTSKNVEHNKKPTDDKDTDNVVNEIENANGKVQASKLISPTKAGLYSALLPGLGQFYNRKYWKIPIVLGAVGTGVGIAIWNDNQYKRYRSAFIAELNGQQHEFSNIPGITKEVLGNTQDRMKRQRDYAVAITAAVYLLNIIDAVVDAHLAPMKNDPDFALSPVIINNPYAFNSSNLGVGVTVKF